MVLPSGHVVGALVAVNALGSPLVNGGPEFWAAPFEVGAEFGGLGLPDAFGEVQMPPTKLGQHGATTIGIVATDAVLSQAQCSRMAVAAHDGFARALLPSHTPMDGDLIFAISTGAQAGGDTLMLGHVAATCMARAVARGVYAARSAAGDIVPAWGKRFGRRTG